ncbi:hypothetical protein FRC96_15140 [Lujinxingia vulgaris]|uniref:Uncharacterized protein n=1 Tax=Lujinxingia vulgaris TaxID=2600176 RepID=A0A5C6X2S5_9DELT|nr:hypothetical protein [Lujinxingia vulgaris]TXD33804.1 hypothetical protein FRC96_15140 [Lujinxingia vulgaris]
MVDRLFLIPPPPVSPGVDVRVSKPGNPGHQGIIQAAIYMSMLAGILACTLACDPGAEERARAIREVVIAATEERAAEAVEAAESEARTTLARTEALQNAQESIVHAMAEGREAMARRKRVEEGMQRLMAKQPESDPSADTMCEKFKFPCSWTDVPREIYSRTLTIGHEIAARMKRGDSVDAIVEWLLDVEGIQYINAEPGRVLIQLEGGMPMPVISTH